MSPGRAQVIPRPLRTTAYALDTCIAGVLGFASTPLVGLLAQHAGYHQSYAAHQPPAEAVRNARALENSLLLLILVSSVAKFVVYTALYWTIRRDRVDEEKDERAAAPVAPSIDPLAPSRETALARVSGPATGGSPAAAAEPVQRRVLQSGPAAV